MRHAPFGRPRHPLGTFPCGKVPRPPAGGRNLPQETDFLWKARERTFLAFSALRRVSPLRRRPGGFPIAPWTPSGPIPICVGKTSHEKQTSCGRQEKGLPFFSVSQRVSPLRRRPKGFPVALWKPSALCCAWGIPQETDSLWQAGKEPSLLYPVSRKVSPLRRRPGGFPLAPWTPSGKRALRIALFSNKTIRPAGTRRGAVPYAFSGGSPQTLSLPLPMLLA